MTLRVWPPLPPAAWVRPARRSLPFPLGDPRCTLFARARHGLWHAVQACGLRPGDRVLVPAYHHGSEVEALAAARLAPVFYRLDADLQPDVGHLDSVAAGARALHLTHYLGFPQDVPRWRAWCSARGMLLVEDAAQAWLASCQGRPVGSSGDVAIFCAYKSFGVPDGGLVVSGAVLDPGPSHGAAGALRPAVRRQLDWMAQRAPRALARLDAPSAEAEAYDAERDFALGDPCSGASRETRHLLPRLVDPSAAVRRRRNYRRLLDHLVQLVPQPWAMLRDGAAPMAFPVQARDKTALLARLRARGVDGLDLWSVPHRLLPDDMREETAELRATVVGLPVHQELRDADLERIVAAMALP